MNKKLFSVLGSVIIAGGLLSGCGSSEDTAGDQPKEEPKSSEQKPKDQSKPSEPKKDEDGNTVLEEVGQTATSEAGTAELLKIKKVNETVNIDPLVITVKDIKVIKLSDVDPAAAEDLSYMADTPVEQLKDGFSYIQVQFTAENTSDKNIEWYDLKNVITDQGEQIDGMMKDFFLDDAETDSQFIGKVKKEYQDGFIVKNDDINSVKLVFSYSEDADTYDKITDEQTVEYTFE